jgi:flagellar protein FliS
MPGLAYGSAHAYSQIDVETGGVAPNPRQLIVILFEGALAAVALAKQHMLGANTPAKGQAISKAVSIITGGLRASLDKTHNADLAGDLDALYGYLCNKLILANLRCQPEWLDDVHRLLSELKQAWEIAAQSNGQIQIAVSPNASMASSNAPQVILARRANEH